MKPKKYLTHEDLAVSIRPTLGRREFLDWMTFQGGSCVPFTELFGPIIGLKEEWEEQGASPAELDLSAFEFTAPKRQSLNLSLGRLEAWQKKVSEDEQSIWFLDDLGRTLRLDKGYATLPLPMNHTIRTMDDWLKIKPRYQNAAARVTREAVECAQEARRRDYAISLHIPGGFDEPRQLLGEEALCIAFYDQPEMIADMLNTMGETAAGVLEALAPYRIVDILDVHEDMAGKSGSLIGPDTIREFIRPYYLRAWTLAQEQGARLFMQDSDGDMSSVIEAFLECGLNCMYPAEPTGGMDIVKLRARFGTRLAFCGGIDKHVLRRTREEIIRELEYKLPPMIRSRGCLLSLDHRIPNGTPLENYRFYLAEAWKIIRRESAGL